jgi:gamma-tubulin complex component 3
MYVMQAQVRRSTRTLVTKLAECGWLHNKVKKYIDSHNKDRSIGLVGQVWLMKTWFCFLASTFPLQSFLAALQQELTDYYRLIAVLESQVGSMPEYAWHRMS